MYLATQFFTMAKVKKNNRRIFNRKPSQRLYDPATEYATRLKGGKWVIRKYWFAERKPTAYNAFQKEFSKVLKEKGVDVKKTKSGSYQKLLSEVWESEKKKNKLDIKGQSKKAVAKKEKATKKFLEKIDASKIFEQIEKQIERLTIKGRTPSEAEKIKSLEGLQESQDRLDYFLKAYETDNAWWNAPTIVQNFFTGGVDEVAKLFIMPENSVDSIEEVNAFDALMFADDLRAVGDELNEEQTQTGDSGDVWVYFIKGNGYLVLTLEGGGAVNDYWNYADEFERNRDFFEQKWGFSKKTEQDISMERELEELRKQIEEELRRKEQEIRKKYGKI